MEENKTIRDGLSSFYSEICVDNPKLTESEKIKIDNFLSQVSSYLVNSDAPFTGGMYRVLRDTIRPYIDIRNATNHGLPRLPRLQSHAERLAGLINDHIIYDSIERSAGTVIGGRVM